MTFQHSLREILEDFTTTTDEKRAAITALVLATIGDNIRSNPGGDPLNGVWCKGYNVAQDDLREKLRESS